MTPARSGTGRRGVAGALLALGALLSACSAHRPPARPEASTTAVRAAYLHYWQVWLAASAGGVRAGDDLPQVTASRQLATLRASLRASQAAGQVARGTVSHRIDIEQVGRQTATLSDCVGLDQWLLYSASTGAILPQLRERPTQAATYTLAHSPTGWKVTDSRPTGTC
jgi:hypothetical protein